MEITTNNFIENFNKVFTEEVQKNLKTDKIWYNAKLYTDTISEHINNIASNLGLKYFDSTYWSLDFIFFKESNLYKNEEYFISEGVYVNKINVIIEHENDFSTSCQEVIKLKLWKADLKVLISKPNPNARKYKEEIMLPLFKKILSNCKDNFLFIFGYKNKSPMFEFYEYNYNIDPHGIIEVKF